MAEVKSMKQNWEESFQEQIQAQAFNTAPVEALVRNSAYYLREQWPNSDYANLHFLEMGCGAGPNLIWLAQKGIKVSGVDISPTALELCRENFQRAGLSHLLMNLIECSVEAIPFKDRFFDGIFESCVFQHLDKQTRERTFREVVRTLKPGGLFCGYMLAVNHSVYEFKKDTELPDDPGSLVLQEGGSRMYLTNIGLSHFFKKEEYNEYLKGFSIVDPCLTEYYLPRFEATKRGYGEYKQSMWAVYAVK